MSAAGHCAHTQLVYSGTLCTCTVCVHMGVVTHTLTFQNLVLCGSFLEVCIFVNRVYLLI